MIEKEDKSYDFIHDGKTFTIKVFQIGSQSTIKVFNDKMVESPVSYSTDISFLDDWFHQKGDILPRDYLIERVKQSIEEGYGFPKDS